ncbi:histidinol-phosphate transaminase [Polynucleobacter sp. AP-Sanab-80-C2]|uniref:histidinol-phosphate transaminase n=1 Tax=unclassified Polynucleobacter TaxID=2640945 RepID=UPI001BFDBACB|nr:MULTISPECIES: histidinol-phosphate transaminase [unclassified Polynucleobacter]MEA9598771.1 histidinol-phosphate transaminase [Polynucleobacter sp. AP-Sanab-80-C2]QWE06752.1 histidinol-phosphate transaminase [Polynucleobacter sp. JS-JIR-5-A7]
MSRFWSPVVQTLTPYVPGEQPQMQRLVKLNTNESPYGPSPKALAAINSQTNDDLRLYPDPEGVALKQAIAKLHGLNPNQVFLGNGSDEVLAHVFAGLLKQNKPVHFPDITYSFYPVYCKLFGIEYQTIPLGNDFEINTSDFCEPNGGVIFPNPNAPTGRSIARLEIEKLLAKNKDSVVVIDEAYVDYGTQSCVPLLRGSQCPENLLVVHTLSKSRALAGLRVGFALGHPTLIEGLERVKNSFNSYPLGRLAQAGAIAAIEDQAHLETTSAKVIQTRTKLVEQLHALGFDTLPSTANFIFTRHPKHSGATMYQALRDRGIIVRHFQSARIEEFLRITIGTDEQSGELVAALKEILS